MSLGVCGYLNVVCEACVCAVCSEEDIYRQQQLCVCVCVCVQILTCCSLHNTRVSDSSLLKNGTRLFLTVNNNNVLVGLAGASPSPLQLALTANGVASKNGSAPPGDCLGECNTL